MRILSLGDTEGQARPAYAASFSLLCATAFLLAMSSVDDLTAQGAAFAGKWKLNEAQSDDAEQKMRDMFQAGGRGGGGIRRSRGAFRRPARGDGDTRRNEMRNVMRSALEAPAFLEISQTESEFRIRYPSDSVRTLYTDGRTIKRERDQGGGEVKTRWKDAKLVVEMKFDRGTKITETCELADDASQLFVTIRVENLRWPQPLEVRRVYDAAEGSQSGSYQP